MQFYPADGFQDCQILTLSARGAWQSILRKAWQPSTRGVLTLNLVAFSRRFSCTVEQGATRSDVSEKNKRPRRA
ncbi:hypothetical protein AW736_23840 [Termitidicoccus mucosus]|uniref:Uncharacterized protein n=1 Tax=Termitidicoccus mucosus TaxID=1184151 RepID=A0A178IDZ1_9BACT|nr:hypothetical protein AW736_23840 [Opitutaceae bacterium TSB47]